jgi:hypothetical protein
MSASLEGPLAKLVRAECQLRVLQQQIDAVWPPRKAWAVRSEVHRDGLEYRFYLLDLPPIDPEWALAAGAIMFNARCALDHLAFELSVRRFRGNVPADIESRTMFPIFDDKDKFSDRRIEHLAKRERRAITHLQPYNTRRDKWQFVRMDLSYLDALHNIDKHRKLHVIAGGQNASVIPWFPDVGFDNRPEFGRVESHAHIDTWTFERTPAKMQDHPGALLHVGLQHGPHSLELMPTLHMVVNGAAEVLRRFKARFPPVTLPEDSAYGGKWWSVWRAE